MRAGVRAAAVVAVVLALLSCGTLWYFSAGQRGNRAHDDAVALWESREPAAYSFDYDYCNGMCMGCRLEVTVRDGVVVEAVAREQSDCEPESAPTVEDVFALEESDRARESTDSFEIRYDPFWGFPASVEIRCPYGTPDCGTGYSISDFEAAS